MYAKDRKEWKYLFDEKKDIELSCFPLQMKVTKLKRELKIESISMEEAVNEVWVLCQKYQRAVKQDMTKIFDF